MRIHLVVNVSQIVRYREQVDGQKKEKGRPIEIAEIEEWEIEKIFNKKNERSKQILGVLEGVYKRVG